MIEDIKKYDTVKSLVLSTFVAGAFAARTFATITAEGEVIIELDNWKCMTINYKGQSIMLTQDQLWEALTEDE